MPPRPQPQRVIWEFTPAGRRSPGQMQQQRSPSPVPPPDFGPRTPPAADSSTPPPPDSRPPEPQAGVLFAPAKPSLPIEERLRIFLTEIHMFQRSSVSEEAKVVNSAVANFGAQKTSFRHRLQFNFAFDVNGRITIIIDDRAIVTINRKISDFELSFKVRFAYSGHIDDPEEKAATKSARTKTGIISFTAYDNDTGETYNGTIPSSHDQIIICIEVIEKTFKKALQSKPIHEIAPHDSDDGTLAEVFITPIGHKKEKLLRDFDGRSDEAQTDGGAKCCCAVM